MLDLGAEPFVSIAMRLSQLDGMQYAVSLPWESSLSIMVAFPLTDVRAEPVNQLPFIRNCTDGSLCCDDDGALGQQCCDNHQGAVLDARVFPFHALARAGTPR